MHHWPKYRYNAFRLRDKLFYRSDGCPQRPCCWESLQWSQTFTHSASSCGKSTPLHYSRITDIQTKKLWNSLKRLVGPFDSELTSLVRVGGKFWPGTRQRATHSFRALWALLPNLFSNSQVNLLASHLLEARWREGGGGVGGWYDLVFSFDNSLSWEDSATKFESYCLFSTSAADVMFSFLLIVFCGDVCSLNWPSSPHTSRLGPQPCSWCDPGTPHLTLVGWRVPCAHRDSQDLRLSLPCFQLVYEDHSWRKTSFKVASSLILEHLAATNFPSWLFRF